ncbi:MAG: fghA [Rhodospirillales bacterium]|nr:fghA [Rhodospirillales bacterium]
MEIETRSTHRCFGGTIGFYTHRSTATGTDMRFAVFVPPHSDGQKLPALYYLAGLTCTEETFMIKAGAQRLAVEYGLILVACDTSPRGAGIADEEAAWDFGTGAGFYVDATQEPWSRHYRMSTYVNDELPALVEAHFPAVPGLRGIFGHSMGGHGALVSALKFPRRWQSVSAFSPIANPVAVPWGQKAFSNYLGPDRASWASWDASLLMRARPFPGRILIDQGTEDQFLDGQLHPEALERAAAVSGQDLLIRRQEGYDHSYWFIQTFVADHIAHHADQLAS